MSKNSRFSKLNLILIFFAIISPLLLSGCSATQAVVELAPIPPAEGVIKAEKPPVFNGKTVGDLVDYNLDLLASYNKLSIRHNALVDWINNYNKKQ